VAHRPERDPDHEIVRVGSRRRLDRGIREVRRILERQRPEPPWWRSIASIVFRYPRSSSDTSGPKRWTRPRVAICPSSPIWMGWMAMGGGKTPILIQFRVDSEA
jgi:hypothetical protein